MKKYVIAAAGLALAAMVVFLWLAVVLPARNAARNLAAINAVSAGQTTEAELLRRKEFQNVPRTCIQESCFYYMEAENTLLSTLHLAPRTSLRTYVAVHEGMVERVSVLMMKDGLQPVAINQVKDLPADCSASPCLKLPPPMAPASAAASVRILIDRQSDLRNHLPDAVNVQCLSQRTGCARYVELVPLLRELPFDESLIRRK